MKSDDVYRPFRLTILASHPIQYHVPFFRALAAHPAFDLRVLYCGAWGVERYHDAGFGQTLAWDVELLAGYRHQFLRNVSWHPDPSAFLGTISPSIVSIIRTDRPDALLIHGWARATNWLAMSAAWSIGVPVWMRGESTLLQDIRPWKRVLKGLMLRFLLPRVSLFLAIGRRNEDFYNAHGVPGDRVVVVPYSADNKFFMERGRRGWDERRQTRKAFGLSEDAPLVLFSGKLVARKRPQDVLSACALVAGHSEVAVAYVGDGAERSALERQARRLGFTKLSFLGVQNQSLLPSLYSAADLMVLPSEVETWGMVVNEAMCCGLPVIVSDRVGAAADLVADGVNGFVYPVGDISALADRIARLVMDDGLRSRMGLEATRRISEWSVDVGVNALAGRVKNSDRALIG